MNNVIVVGSDDSAREQISTRLRKERYEVAACGSKREAIEHAAAGADAVFVVDAPADASLLDLIRELRQVDAATPVIALLSAQTAAIDVLRAGAFYVTRPPLDVEEAALLTQRALESTQGLRAARSGGNAAAEEDAMLVGETPAMNQLHAAIRRLGESPDTAVLITGESGTGKVTAARAIHAVAGRGGPFLRLSPAALPEPALEAELFGVEQSADHAGQLGMLERAHAGTLYIDEVADLPRGTQAKLLRFLQEKVFRRIGAGADRSAEVRVIAASGRDLNAAVQEGKLRPELLYRLAAVTLALPALRERLADIPALSRHVLARFAARSGRKPRSVSERAMKALVEHSWPGNVRELVNVLERAALLGDSDVIDSVHPAVPVGRPGAVEYQLPSQGIDFRELEREVVLQALRHARGNQTRAATLLGMTRDQIRYRMAKFGMSTRGDSVRVSSENGAHA
jgi:two-component system response regulator HydG